jgi:hypothetical protein
MSSIRLDDNRNPIEVYLPSTSQVFSVGNTTAASTAFGAGVTLVRVAASLGHCHVSFGTAPTASITTSMMIPTNSVGIFKVNVGDKIAYIKDATVAASTLCVTELA